MAVLQTKNRIYILNIIGWCLILGISFFWSAHSENEGINSVGLIMLFFNMLPLMLIYVVNNIFIIPKYLFQDRKGMFFIVNIVLLALLLWISYHYSNHELVSSLGFDVKLPRRPRADLAFLARDLINYILMVGFVTSLQLMERLRASEEALKEAENARIKAELTNLRSQLNPHFLLNTLNNIYALTAIDAEKAQKTIKELSLLLRYVLYDNLSEKVLLVKEVEFLKNYIELMRIRLTNHVRLNVEYAIAEDSSAQIAPLIFISLIENAFKHGVDANRPSFIEIRIEHKRDCGEVILSIRNSNNAKRDNDKSGKGVGLDQVRRRLELQYQDAYSWEINDTSEVYESIITLKNVD